MSGHRGNKYSWKLLLSDVLIFLHCSLAQRFWRETVSCDLEAINETAHY